MSEPDGPTIAIVDDDRDTREALEFLLASADYQCASFATGEAFLERPLPSPPCCLLLDLQLEGKSGLEVQNELNARQAVLPVLFVSGDDSVARAVSAMRAGALDFMQKPLDSELLLKRVEHALEVSTSERTPRRSADHDAALVAGLTQREHEVLALLMEGNTRKRVAKILDISTRTVEIHHTEIMQKLESRTLADLIRARLNDSPHDSVTH